MGSTPVIYAVVAVALALVCLLGGFLWGRSNVKAKLEQALEQEHTSLDAREYAMRQQLEDAIAEVARLRPLAEELARVQDRLKLEQSKYEQMKSEFGSTLRSDSGAAEQESSSTPPEPAPVPESPDAAIQRLLQSLENLDEPPELRSFPAAEPQPIQPSVPQIKTSVPPVARELPKAPPPVERKPVGPPVTQPAAKADDEWQEFARSLADLARRTK